MNRATQRFNAAVTLALVGGLVMWYSSAWADQASRTYINSFTSSNDTVKRADYAASLRLMGAVMLGVGLFRALEPRRDE